MGDYATRAQSATDALTVLMKRVESNIDLSNSRNISSEHKRVENGNTEEQDVSDARFKYGMQTYDCFGEANGDWPAFFDVDFEINLNKEAIKELYDADKLSSEFIGQTILTAAPSDKPHDPIQYDEIADAAAQRVSSLVDSYMEGVFDKAVEKHGRNIFDSGAELPEDVKADIQALIDFMDSPEFDDLVGMATPVKIIGDGVEGGELDIFDIEQVQQYRMVGVTRDEVDYQIGWKTDKACIPINDKDNTLLTPGSGN